MSSAAGPLYELIFQAEPGTDAGLQSWLSELREQLLQHDTVAEARLFKSGSDTNAVTTWILQLPCQTEDILAEMQASIFANVDAALAEEFGDAASVSSRVLRQEAGEEIPGIDNTDCLNCGAPLQGQYCGICGQRARSRLISLWELISDAFGDLLEMDSRLWRTLIPLFMRPGQLTRDYLEGRRARYMPPFRTYLVLSVIFFVVAFFDPRDDLSLLFEPQAKPTAEQQAEEAAQVAAAKKEILDELAKEGIIVGNTVIEGEQQADEESNESTENTDDDFKVKVNELGDAGFNIQIDDDTGACNVEADDLDELPEWFKRRFTVEKIREVCEKVTADGGKSLGDLLLDNIPVALIVLLPLMALVLKILYPLSRRYFVEHILFVIHYHAFFFLILILQILFARFAALIHIPELITSLTIVAASLYIPVYLYMAMRHVYGQGRFLTFLKYVALVVAYNVGTAVTLLGALLFALVSVTSN